MNTIEISDLKKIYPGNIVANDRINLDIPQGEFFCLLGPNGAGKSTLVRQISTEIYPTGGAIHVSGINVAKNPVKAKREMGVMPQECGLFEHLTINQHIKIFSDLKGLSRAERSNAEEILACLSLEKHCNAKIENLSLGMKKKVLLTTALLGNPPVLLLDEPSTGLDPESRINVWNMLLAKKKQGCTVLLTTHHFDEAEMLSDRFGIIASARIVHLGTIESLRSQLNHLFELKYEDTSKGVCSEHFSKLSSAFEFIEKQKPSVFSLSNGSLEKIYFDLVNT